MSQRLVGALVLFASNTPNVIFKISALDLLIKTGCPTCVLKRTGVKVTRTLQWAHKEIFLEVRLVRE